jgi:hypothetical protein
MVGNSKQEPNMKLILIAATALGFCASTALASEVNPGCTELKANWENAPPQQCIPEFPKGQQPPALPPIPDVVVPG